eukprot:TRINITY_DN1050_c0_g1_i3.p1 TRINITY_DN1050_c0_g1~~TRINITY_DN1050_c0_g1_i3.p1  ORF type:complete len:294 (-),score=39.13 TRINITY_DN1050_c0_g1_i3:80-895(-)
MTAAAVANERDKLRIVLIGPPDCGKASFATSLFGTSSCTEVDGFVVMEFTSAPIRCICVDAPVAQPKLSADFVFYCLPVTTAVEQLKMLPDVPQSCPTFLLLTKCDLVPREVAENIRKVLTASSGISTVLCVSSRKDVTTISRQASVCPKRCTARPAYNSEMGQYQCPNCKAIFSTCPSGCRAMPMFSDASAQWQCYKCHKQWAVLALADERHKLLELCAIEAAQATAVDVGATDDFEIVQAARPEHRQILRQFLEWVASYLRWTKTKLGW